MTSSSSAGAVPGARFVDPKVLARIGNLELVARAVVDGFINGLHRSPYFGASVDFAEHRGYVPGDDIRRVDWRLYARTDRYYIKEYEADSNTNFSVLLDVSKSMGFGSRGITKLDYARMLAGCLTYLVHHQRDRVGFVAFDNDIVEHVPPSAKHMDDGAARARSAEAGAARAACARRCTRWRSTSAGAALLVLISDFYEEPEAVLEAVGAAAVPRQRHHRVPRARPGGAGLRVRRSVGVRGSRERRADAGRARGACASSTGRWCRRTSTR